MPHYARLVLQGKHCCGAWFQPLAGAPGVGGHPSIDWLGLRLEPPLKSHHCNDKSECPVAASMSTVLSHINDRIEKAVESELKRLTVADLLASYIEADA